MGIYGSTRMTTVNRRQWLAERIRFLEGQLEQEVSDDRRTAIQAEIEALRKESGSSRWWRRLLGILSRPTDR
jgi:hypothetical protein